MSGTEAGFGGWLAAVGDQMPTGDGICARARARARSLLIAFFVCFEPLLSHGADGGACELSVRYRNALYNYSLAVPTSKYPHGALSEDGFYKVVVNDTSLWFQLCDHMIFNHNPPSCQYCQDCGDPSHCGMMCSALVANDIGGYSVCKSLGLASNQHIALIDQNNPLKGVLVKTASVGVKINCSLSVSVFCHSNEVQVSNTLNLTGNCDYAVVVRHPSGCAKVTYINGEGLGWFGTIVMIIFCFLVGYFLVGTIYRFFFLGIHGAAAVPNLDFWLSLPGRAKSMLGDLVRRFSGHARDSRGSYASVNY